MVAKTPRMQNKMATSVNPIHVRETLQKVERCMARLQELQYTVTGDMKFVSSVKHSPRSTSGFLRTSISCNRKSMRNAEEWQKMSLQSMLLSETMAEILHATKTVASIDPRTPDACSRNRKPLSENTELRARRAKEKQNTSRALPAEAGSPIPHRARSRISFKATSPVNKKYAMNSNGTRASVSVNWISPRKRPWARKTVLFPNPLFLSTSPASTHQKKFYKTRSPIIARTSQKTPHKFLIKSPPTTLGSQFQSKRAVPAVAASTAKIKGMVSKPRQCSFSPSKLANRFASLLETKHVHEGGRGGMTSGSQFKSKKGVLAVGVSPSKIKGLPSKLRRYSFSPSKFANNRLVSPIWARISFRREEET